MKSIALIQGFEVYPLYEEFAKKNVDELTRLANLIPGAHYLPEEILAEKKGERIMHNKWEYSLRLMDGERLIGFIIAYGRDSEANEQYPFNTLYVNILAINEKYQRRGLGRAFLTVFLDYAKAKGSLGLSGDFNFSIQTNGADWNAHIKRLYESFGFKQRATKQYGDGLDLVLGWKP